MDDPTKNICIFVMAENQHSYQRAGSILRLICKEEYFIKNFYFTGGTPLSAFYLFHRLSEDIDLFLKKKLIFSD